MATRQLARLGYPVTVSHGAQASHGGLLLNHHQAIRE